MHKKAASVEYHPSLDIVRGIAVTMVILYHVFWYVSFFRLGWIGVDLFFVLSGYLITDILLRSRENRYYFSKFYIKRILRIFPVYYLVLFAFFSLSPVFFSIKLPGSTYTYYNHNQIWYWLFIQNWLTVWKGTPTEPYLLHFWSLAIEEQFYILWPVTLYFIKQLETLKKLIILLIFIALLLRISICILHPQQTEELYYNTFTRMDSLLFGCLISIQVKQEILIPTTFIKLIILSFIALIFTSITLLGNVQHDNRIFVTIGYTISAAFFGIIIYLLVTYEKKLDALIKNGKVFSFLAKISYSLYIIHLPVYLITAYILSHNQTLFLPLLVRQKVSISLFSLLITLLLSIASFNIIEKRFLSLKKYLP
jgi:peptidoglycan/LPS O-acetylase OafA/YrhL